MFGFEKKKQKEDIINSHESIKNINDIMTQLSANILDKTDQAIIYEIDEDISGSELYKQLGAENPDLEITSTEGMYGKYEVTVAVKQSEDA